MESCLYENKIWKKTQKYENRLENFSENLLKFEFFKYQNQEIGLWNESPNSVDINDSWVLNFLSLGTKLAGFYKKR